MKHYKWQAILGISLIVASAFLYIVQIDVFHDPRNTFFYLLQDVAFIPIQVLLVTLILNQLLNVREKMAMLNKMNMVIGTFFSEVGTGLLKQFAELDQNTDTLRKELLVTGQWSDRQFSEAASTVSNHDCQIDYVKADLIGLKSFLAARRNFLLRLLENSNLLEHETFTELLWAVFHLNEELTVRQNLTELVPTDANHIAGDIRRAYLILITEWLAYMKHLKSEYPYLFSLAVRMNPFDPYASPIVK
jgi:hypothetical protein